MTTNLIMRVNVRTTTTTFREDQVHNTRERPYEIFCAPQRNLCLNVSSDSGIQALPALRFYKGGKEVMEPVIDYKKKHILSAVEKPQKA